MYGSILRAKIKPGKKEEYLRLVRSEVPTAEDYGQGLHSVEAAFEDKDPDRVVMIIHFKDRESYTKNADRAETNEQWERQAALLEDVEWIDVNYVDYIGKPIGEGATASSS
jgi:quinol monooxygenase YgiN